MPFESSFMETTNSAMAIDFAQASGVGNVDLVQRQLAQQPNLVRENISYESGHAAWTSLHISASKNQTAVMKLVIDSGGSMEAGDVFGNTPLMMAAYEGAVDAVKLLLENGANIQARRTDSGMTALDWARQYGRTQVVALLEEEQRTG
eukprot:7055583-Prymnesium_polylepis.1